MDRLSSFFANFSLSARVFFSGQLCGLSSDHVTETAGHLHVLRSGVLKILQTSGPPITISQPTVLFYPRPRRHIFQADKADGTDLLCAFVEFGAGMLNPLTSALPEPLMIPLASVPELAPTVQLLFAEAFSQHDGRQAALDRLAEYFMVLLLRAAMDAQLITGGILPWARGRTPGGCDHCDARPTRKLMVAGRVGPDSGNVSCALCETLSGGRWSYAL
jgi:Cupin